MSKAIMNTTGYSGKPVWQKLGILPNSKIYLVEAPKDYAKLIGWTGKLAETKDMVDIAHCFVTSQASLQQYLPLLTKKVVEGGSIWISWYKKSAGIPTDLTEDRIRDIVLPTGWVDVKVCSVSDQWSGLKFMRRRK